jgi:hypothetical protein
MSVEVTEPVAGPVFTVVTPDGREHVTRFDPEMQLVALADLYDIGTSPRETIVYTYDGRELDYDMTLDDGEVVEGSILCITVLAH